MNNKEKGNYLFVCDCGKNSSKSFFLNFDGTLINCQSFPSRIEEHIGRWHSDVTDKITNMEIEGKKYKVGSVAGNKYNLDDTKINKFHRNLVYTSIARQLYASNLNDIEIDLAIGLPSLHADNEESVQTYIKLMLGESNGEVTLKIYNEEKRFTIKNVSVYSESDATLQRKLINTQFPDEDIQVVDIGGQNIGIVLFKNGKIRQKFTSLNRVGMNYLTSDLNTHLTSCMSNHNHIALNIDFDRAILKGKISEIEDSDLNNEYFKTTSDFLNHYICEYMEDDVISVLLSKNIDLKDHNKIVLLTGGGATRLYPYIKKLLPKVNVILSTTPRWDNCVSYALLELKNIHQPKKSEENRNKFTNAVAILMETVKKQDLQKKFSVVLDV